MSSKLAGRDAVCPFYEWHKKDEIVCEGPIPDSKVHNVMPPQDALLHYREFCCGRWKNCEIARANEWKYEDE